MDNRSSFGVPSGAAAQGHGGAVAAQSELAVNRMHQSFTIEGSASIKRLTSVPHGQIVFLYCMGSPTFVDSTALFCPGRRDMAASPGDMIIARSLGNGAWRILDRLAAVGRVASFAPQGRLTLTSGAPVMQSSAAGQTTICYTPAVGDQIPLYDGAGIIPATFAELSQLTTDTTKSPAAVTTNKNYDLFVWDDAGTLRLSRGPTWNSGAVAGSDVLRGTGAGSTELVRIKGLLLNANAITNGPAAQRGTYVGTVRSNGTSTIDWILGTSATGGGAALLNVWNAYNRVLVKSTVADTTANWSYTSGTARNANNSAGNRISFVMGLAEDGLAAFYQASASTTGVLNQYWRIGLCMDATNFDVAAVYQNNAATATTRNLIVAKDYTPQIGFHYVQATEASDGANAATFNGGGSNSLSMTLVM